MGYDLHVHTTASDGLNTPQEIIAAAAAIGLEGIAITDHDTLDGLAAAEDYISANRVRIDFIPGVELNTDYGEDEVHILGYFIDYLHGDLAARLLEIRQARLSRAEKMVARLQDQGIDIPFAQVKKLAAGGLVGRPHVARALIQGGWVKSEEEAFDRYIGRGQPAYVPRYKFKPEEAIDLVKKAGGIAVLAHPGLIKDKAIILEVIAMGIEGLEVFYPEHSPEQVAELSLLADTCRLLKTGGSDYHGPGSSASRNRLGLSAISSEMMRLIRDYYQHKNPVGQNY